jgi:hypothetical protein
MTRPLMHTAQHGGMQEHPNNVHDFKGLLSKANERFHSHPITSGRWQMPWLSPEIPLSRKRIGVMASGLALESLPDW